MLGSTASRLSALDIGTMEPTDYDITDAMITYGGGFVSALGALYRCADSENQRILKLAFAHYWDEYRELWQIKRRIV